MSPSAEKAKSVSIDFIITVLQKAVAGVVATSFLLSIVWFFARNEVQDTAREFVGTNEVLSKTEEVAVVVAEQRERLEALSVQVEALVPPAEIVEYDALRSYLKGPCTHDVACSGQLRARRTEFGKTCGTPQLVARWFVDSFGRRFAADREGEHRPLRLQDEWVVIQVDFVVPPLASPGLGEFYMDLRYECLMDSDGDPETPTVKVPIERQTLRLTVEISD